MKFDRDFKPELCVSKDPFRHALNHVELDTENKRLCATDGHMLVAVPVTIDDGDVSGPVSTEALKAARKAAPRGCEGSIKANGALAVEGGATFPRPDRAGQNFPRWQMVVPQERKVMIALDADKLAKLADAIGANKSQVSLAFDPGDLEGAIRVYALGTEKDEHAPIAILICRAGSSDSCSGAPRAYLSAGRYAISCRRYRSLVNL